MRVIQVARRSWLVLDGAFRPRFLIVYAAAVDTRTHETHIIYRVDRWALDREHRATVHWCETLAEATAYCAGVLDEPDFVAPIRNGYGTAIPVNVQRERWQQGLDPRTGEPRHEEGN